MHVHVYCVPRGVKRQDIVKEILMIVLWYVLEIPGTKFTHWMSQTLNSISFFEDILNVQVFCKEN